jgi:hypothetical protein
VYRIYALVKFLPLIRLKFSCSEFTSQFWPLRIHTGKSGNDGNHRSGAPPAVRKCPSSQNSELTAFTLMAQDKTGNKLGYEIGK